MTQRWKLTLEYDGTGLGGWQKQADRPTAQGLLEAAIHKMTGETVATIGSGRTDAGVHARGQVAHVDITREFSAYQLRQGLNFHLGHGPLGVLEVEKVSHDFHARFNAKQRSYQYRIINRQTRPVLEANRAWHLFEPLDHTMMHEAAQYLIGKHDFTSFRAAGCQASSPLKTLDAISVQRHGDWITLEISALSFLYHMVRNITGSLVEVGKANWPPEKVQEILQAQDRSEAGPTAPACGLYFMKAIY